MLKRLLFFTLIAFSAIQSNAQDKVLDSAKDIKQMDKKDAKEGWTKSGAIGLDLALLNLINPRAGAGDNRLGFGGLLGYQANLKQGKILWDNKFNLQLAVVKVASDPFTKANDVLQFTSQWGYQISENGKWYGAALFDFQTQFLPTYGANFLAGDAVPGKTLTLAAQFLAPAIFKFAPGVIYKPSADFKVMYSPIAVRTIVVANDVVARQAAYIPLKIKTDPNSFQTTDFQLGSELRAEYNHKFNDNLVYSSIFDIYSNYLREPQNMAIEWYNSLDFKVYKNVSVNLKTDLFYDHNILVNRGGDVKNQGRDVFIRNALFVKYGMLF